MGSLLSPRPDKRVRASSLLRRLGLTPAAAYSLAALRSPDRAAIIDELGTLTFHEVHRRTNALARALSVLGVADRATVAIVSRNHRGFIETTVACSKLRADLLCLDPALSDPALADIVGRESPDVLIYDEEFSERVGHLADGARQLLAWRESSRLPYPTLEELIARTSASSLSPSTKSRQNTVLLAREPLASNDPNWRRLPDSLMIPAAVVSTIPLRPAETTLVAAPMSRPWGFLHLTLAMRLSSTLVLRREFDPNSLLTAASGHRVSAVALEPDMLRGIVELPGSLSASHDTEALRVIAVPAPMLSSDLAMPAVERFGDVLYNLQGSPVVRLDQDCVGQTKAPPIQRERSAISG